MTPLRLRLRLVGASIADDIQGMDWGLHCLSSAAPLRISLPSLVFLVQANLAGVWALSPVVLQASKAGSTHHDSVHRIPLHSVY